MVRYLMLVLRTSHLIHSLAHTLYPLLSSTDSEENNQGNNWSKRTGRERMNSGTGRETTLETALHTPKRRAKERGNGLNKKDEPGIHVSQRIHTHFSKSCSIGECRWKRKGLVWSGQLVSVVAWGDKKRRMDWLEVQYCWQRLGQITLQMQGQV